MADLRIEQLPTALALVLGDLFPLAAVNEQIATGYEAKHITAAEVAAAILTTFEQAGLSTTSKTIVGALNEIVTALSNMSDVIGGTADPTSAQGNDYDLYVKYQVNGNAVSVVGFYVKLSGAWVTIATGSASVFLITLTESGSSWTADKTAAEIDAAYEAGEIMMCTSGSAPVRYFHLDSYITGTGFKQYIFEEVTRTAYWEFTISTHGGQTSIVLLTGSIPAINDSLTHVSTVWSSKKTHDEDVATLASARDLLYSMLPTDTASGAVASFPDGADNVPVVAAVANIDYDENGYTGMKIYETGANFLGGSKLLANAQAYLTGGTTDTENKTFTFAATSTPTTGRSFSDGCKFKENTPYTIILRFAKSNTRDDKYKSVLHRRNIHKSVAER